MKYFLALIMLMHGLIHFMGFAKAFGYGSITQLTADISKSVGALWLLTGLLFLCSTALLLLKTDWWWMVALIAVVISQVLIITNWTDAKFGTVANIIILAAIVAGYGAWQFSRVYQQDVSTYLMKFDATAPGILTEADIQPLPPPVQKYLRFTGSVGKPKVKNFRVAFDGKIRKDETAPWMPFRSEQYNFLTTPTRLFFMKASMKNMPVAGYHAYRNGDAFMDIRLLSLFRVQYETGKEMGIAETVTFFNDMCCMAPATLIDNRIKWLNATENKVQASFTTNDITITAWLYFDEEGALVNFISNDRYALLEDGSMKQLPWSTPLKNYREINGYKLPGYAEAIYHYPEGDMCYGTFSMTDVNYNYENLD